MKTVSPIEAFKALQENQALLIDVREQSEYDEYHIEGAILVSLSNLPAAIQNIDFTSNKDKKIIFQCLKGGRSAQAIDYLQGSLLKGYDIYNFEGGILAWIDKDLPVITMTKA